MKARLKHIEAVNYLVSIAAMVLWLIYAWLVGLPIDERFLGFPNIEGSPWIDALIFDTFPVWCVFRAPPITVVTGRLTAAFAGLAGLGWLFIAPLMHSGVIHITWELLVGIY